MSNIVNPKASVSLKRTPLKRSTPLKRTSIKSSSSKPKKPKRKVGKQTLANKADRLAGAICRSVGECQACLYEMRTTKGVPIPCSGGLQWCHVMSRRYYAIRWDARNCVCMCASHHRYFTLRPLEFGAFIESIDPGATAYLRDKLREPFTSSVAYLSDVVESLKLKAAEMGVSV